MANRYWVGGTSTWNNTAGSKWSLTSGGAGGQAVPTASDDVFFDSASGAVTITTGAAIACKSLTCTGFTGTFAGTDQMNLAGNITLVAGMTFTWSGILFTQTNAVQITSGGKTFSGELQLNTNLTFGDAFISTSGLSVEGNITINDSGFNLKFAYFKKASVTLTLTMGATTWEVTGNNSGVPWTFGNSGAVTMSANSANILKFTDTSNTNNTYNWNVGNSYPTLTFGNIWFARGASTGSNTLDGKMVFNNLKDTGTAAHSLIFAATILGASFTVTTWTVSGSSGNVITLTSNIPASFNWDLICASGTISSDYLSIARSTASGGASFYAGANSTDGGNNSGWVFTAPPSGVNTGAFFNFF